MPTTDDPRPTLTPAGLAELRRTIERYDPARDACMRGEDPAPYEAAWEQLACALIPHRHALLAAAEMVASGVEGVVGPVGSIWTLRDGLRVFSDLPCGARVLLVPLPKTPETEAE